MGLRPMLEHRVLTALNAAPSRIPVLIGSCGAGRTSILHAVADGLGRNACQYIDVERIATTPERFLQSVRRTSPFSPARPTTEAPATPREAFDLACAFFKTARLAGGEQATFLFDEVLEIRTFESFPGLRTALRELVGTLAESPNRFLLASRFVNRSTRLLKDAPARFEIVQITPLEPSELRPPTAWGETASDKVGFTRQTLHALADGRPGYVKALLEAMGAMWEEHGEADPICAMVAQLAVGGSLYHRCRFCYEFRLHRARGYGALKAILAILAEEEPLTLTQIAQRLRRTPGSTKDYLSWLEDVDLLSVRRKRYMFSDPVLRLWVKLHCRDTAPSDEDIAREVHAYALPRLPRSESALAMATGSTDQPREKGWGIEFD